MSQKNSIINVSVIDATDIYDDDDDGVTSDSSLDNISNQIHAERLPMSEAKPLPAEIVHIEILEAHNNNIPKARHERIVSAFQESPGQPAQRRRLENVQQNNNDNSSDSEELFALNEHEEKNCLLQTPGSGYVDKKNKTMHIMKDIEKKIQITQSKTMEVTQLFQNVENEQFLLEQEIENKFQELSNKLYQQKQMLLADVFKFISEKTIILNTKIESLCTFQTTLNGYKMNITQNGGDIEEIHEECTKKFVYTVEKTLAGIPDIKLDIKQENENILLHNISSFGEIINDVNITDVTRLKPTLNMVTNNGKDNIVGISWKLTESSFIGIDMDLVSNIKFEWLQIDEFKEDDEIKEDYDLSLNENEIEAKVDEYIQNNDVIASKKWSSKSFLMNVDSIGNNNYFHEINTRRQGLFIIRLKLIANHKDNFVLSSMQFLKIFRKKFNYICDVWDHSTKNNELKIGVFNKQILSRSVPGNWKNCFGRFSIQNGVNIWTLKIKKKDKDRKFVSVMFGIIANENASKKQVGGCFAYGNGYGKDGFGFYAANGCIYNTSKYGQPYIENYVFKNNDVISIIVDYYKGTLVFDINNCNNNNNSRNKPQIAFYIDRKKHYKLAVSMRGCDEIQLIHV